MKMTETSGSTAIFSKMGPIPDSFCSGEKGARGVTHSQPAKNRVQSAKTLRTVFKLSRMRTPRSLDASFKHENIF
jgi:hypothetical protein